MTTTTAVLCLSLLAVAASAAWVAVQNFNTYTLGDLNGQACNGSGGSGWAAATNWANDNLGQWDVLSTPVLEGAQTAGVETNGDRNTECALASTDTSGIVQVTVRFSATDTRLALVLLTSGDVVRWKIYGGHNGFLLPNDIILSDDVTAVSCVVGFSLNTNYVIDVSYDTNANTAKCRQDSDTVWSAAQSGAGTGAIGAVRLQNNDVTAGNGYFDDIKAGTDLAAAGGKPNTGWWFFFSL